MSEKTTNREGSIFKLPTNRMEAIIFLCGFFSFFTTWAGAYKVTSFFSNMPFLGLDEEVLHVCFSLFTAGTIFYIIFSILMNNLEKPAEALSRKASTTYMLAGTTVIALSFWLSVEGLTEGYRNFRLQQILAPYQGDEARFLAEVEKEIGQPVIRLTKELKEKLPKLNEQDKEYDLISNRLDDINRDIEALEQELNAAYSMQPDSTGYKNARIRSINWQLGRLRQSRDQLQNRRSAMKAVTRLEAINNVREQLSTYRFGKTSPDTLAAVFSRGETLLGTNADFGFQRDKADELHEVQTKLTAVQTGYNSFLSVIRQGLQRNEDGSRGFVIIILFFALLGDIVPLLISLKNNNPNTIQGFFKESVQWFHSMTDELARVDFVRRVSRACVGFLFSLEETSGAHSFKTRYLNPIARWTALEPMVFTFNFLLAVTIIWSLIGFVMDDVYFLHISRIFDNWTTGLLTWVEQIQ